MQKSVARKLIFTFFVFVLAACEAPEHAHSEHDHHAHHHGHGEEHEPDFDKGPHNGRLLVDGDFAVELAVFEDGVPPEFRAWITERNTPLSPDSTELTVELTRLGGDVDRFEFSPQADFLRGKGVVAEPHSFDVSVEAIYKGHRYRWDFESHEGRVVIPQERAREAGIVVARAQARAIPEVLPLYGQIVVNPEAVRSVGARFPGLIKQVSRSVGDSVKAGDVLARVESNDSLQIYSVTAPIDGTVTERRADPGEPAGEQTLFEISDLSQLWARFEVFPRDFARARIGQQVLVTGLDGQGTVEAKVVRLAPATVSASSRALSAWAALESGQADWAPGQYVTGELLVAREEVPVAVRKSALQMFRDFNVVFARIGQTYEVRMLELGRSDGEYVEVLSGLKPNTEYVVENSYLIKADIEKSGASHDH